MTNNIFTATSYNRAYPASLRSAQISLWETSDTLKPLNEISGMIERKTMKRVPSSLITIFSTTIFVTVEDHGNSPL